MNMKNIGIRKVIKILIKTETIRHQPMLFY